MQVIETGIPEVKVIKPEVFSDARGFFYESFQADRYAKYGINLPFVQDNVSRSSKNVLRGLHYQLKKPQGKLVWVNKGAVLDVAIDIRRGSPTFGQYVAVELTDQNRLQLYVPPGFAHGYCVLSNQVDFQYKCTDYYHPDSEFGIIWNDPTLNIEWPIDNPVLSEKDKNNYFLANLKDEELPMYNVP